MNDRRLAWMAGAGCALWLASCAPAPPTLEVQLVTDYEAGREFDTIRLDDGRTSTTYAARVDRSYGRAQRVATLELAMTASLSVTLTLERHGLVVQAQPRRLTPIAGRNAVTFLITRDCAGVVCPAADADAIACIGGICVDPTCTTEHPEACPASCAATCPASPIPCVERSCRAEGVCFSEARDERCGASEVCSTQLGCVPAGGFDAGPDEGDGSLPDAGEPDASEPDAGEPDAAIVPNQPPVLVGGRVLAMGPGPHPSPINATDTDGDAVRVIVLRAPTHGTLTLAPSLADSTYTPEPGFVGVDSVVLVAFDERLFSTIGEMVYAVIPPPPDPAPGANIPLAACGPLSAPGHYSLTTDLSASGPTPCLEVTADDVDIDGGGHTITGPGSVGVYGVSANDRGGLSVHDLVLRDFDRGVSLVRSTGAVVRAVSVFGPGEMGFYLEDTDDSYLIDSSTDGVGSGAFLTTFAERDYLIRLHTIRSVQVGVHLYDEAQGDWIIDSELRDGDQGVSCDRCQRLSIVGAAVHDVAGAAAQFTFAASGHRIFDMNTQNAEHAFLFEHWGGCDDVLVEASSQSDVRSEDVYFEAGSPHTQVMFRAVATSTGIERNDSGSSFQRSAYAAVRVVDLDGSPRAGVMLRFRRSSGVSMTVTTDGDGLTPLLEGVLYEEVVGVRASFTYDVLDDMGATLATDLPLTNGVVDVVL